MSSYNGQPLTAGKSGKIRRCPRPVLQLSCLIIIILIVYFSGILKYILSPADTSQNILLQTDSPELHASSPKADTIFFQLFTRENRKEPQILQPGDATLLEQSYFNKSLPTKIDAHGFGGRPSSSYGARDGLLDIEDCNFIAVDWSELASDTYEVVGRDNVPIVGIKTAALVDFLVYEGASLGTFHLIGFSMGAHVVGIAGSNVKSGRLPRITGLDPADAFFFNRFDKDHRLDISDAEFIDVIHTSARSDLEPIAHADFFPNGGILQPGCPPLESDRTCCNHCRAVLLFVESITSSVGFRSVPCDSWESYEKGNCNGNVAALMGNPLPLTAKGPYYLTTNDRWPFAKG